WFTLNIISGIKLYFEFISSDLIQYKSQLIQRYMSRMNNNQVPLQQQQQQQQAPPLQLPLGSGGVYGGNQYNYQNGYQNGDNQYGYRNRSNRYFYSNQNRNYNNRPRRRKNSFFNRNFMQQQPYFNNADYNNDGMMISRPFLPNRRFNQNRQYNRNRQFNQNRPRSRSNGSTPIPRRSRSGQRCTPRPLRLNDFMPSELRDNSPNAQYLASNFNLATTTTDATPADALPQRQRFALTAASSTDTTQPFAISNQADGANQQQQQRTNNGQRQRTTTAAHRRRQRRNHQQQYQQQNQADDNPNRFVALAEDDTSNQIDTETTINDRPA
ncbi:unnamed protein product, partial [Adineta ricciae]